MNKVGGNLFAAFENGGSVGRSELNVFMPMLKENGQPKIFYHSSDADFTEMLAQGSKGYQRKHSLTNYGIYFHEAPPMYKYGKNQYEAHLDIRNPFIIDNKTYISDVVNPYTGKRIEVEHINLDDVKYLKEQGYDAVMAKYPSFQTVVFEPSQVKIVKKNGNLFSSFENGGVLDEYTKVGIKKVYVSIRIKREIKRADGFGMNYEIDYIEPESFEGLRKGVLDGVLGVSTSSYNVSEWLTHRECLIVMPFNDFLTLNNTEQVKYLDADYLTKNGLEPFFRLYDRKERDDSAYYSVLQNLFPKISHEFYLEHLSDSKGGLYDLVGHIFNPYNSSKFIQYVSSQPRIQSPEMFAQIVCEYINSGTAQSDYYRHKEFDGVQVEDIINPLTQGIVSSGRIYRDESEWLLNDKQLIIPTGSQLFFVNPSYPNFKEKNEKMIDAYKLRDFYKISYIDYTDLSAFQAKRWAKKEENFKKELTQLKSSVDKKISNVLVDIENEILDKFERNVFKELDEDEFMKPEYFKDFDGNKYSNFMDIPEVINLYNNSVYKLSQIIESVIPEIVKRRDKYYLSQVESQFLGYLELVADENNNRDFEFMNEYGNTFSYYGFIYTMKRAFRDIGFNKYADSIKERVGSDLYRAYSKDEIMLNEGGSTGSSIPFKNEYDTLIKKIPVSQVVDGDNAHEITTTKEIAVLLKTNTAKAYAIMVSLEKSGVAFKYGYRTKSGWEDPSDSGLKTHSIGWAIYSKPNNNISSELKKSAGGGIDKYSEEELIDFAKNAKFKVNPSNTYTYFNVDEHMQIRVTNNKKKGVGKGYHVTTHLKSEDGIGYDSKYSQNVFADSLFNAKKTAGELYFNHIREDVSNDIDLDAPDLSWVSKMPTTELQKRLDKTRDFNESAEIVKELKRRSGYVKKMQHGGYIDFTSKGGNKIVDENGEPLLLYHGTPESFDSFDISNAGKSTDSGMFGKGFYFTDSKKEADTYTKRGVKAGKVIEVNISMKNPYIINNKSDIPKINTPQETIEDLRNSAENYSAAFTKYLQDKGYDGVIDNLSSTKQYVVFDKSQINRLDTVDKSGRKMQYGGDVESIAKAIENSGENARKVLDKSIPPLTIKEFFKKFKRQHKDVKNKTEEGRELAKKSIIENGINEGFNVNALPIFQYPEPSAYGNQYGNKKGDLIYLLPKQGFTEGANGSKTKQGYKPEISDIVLIEYDNQPTYEAYVNQLKNPKHIAELYYADKVASKETNLTKAVEYLLGTATNEFSIGGDVAELANKEGFKVNFYDGKGQEGGVHTGRVDEIYINKNIAKGDTTFYLKGVEADMKGSHTIEIPTEKAILFHEIGHKMFSNKSELGHKILDKLKEYRKSEDFGHPTGYSATGDLFDATMMDFFAFYKLAPKELKASQPKAFELMKKWEDAYKISNRKSEKDVRIEVIDFENESETINTEQAVKDVEKIAKNNNVNILRGKDLKSVAVDKEGKIIGGLWTEVNGDEFSFDVVIDKTSQGQGVGEKLVKDVISQFNNEKEANPNLKYKVDVTNPIMEKLLSKYGFKVYEQFGDHIIMGHPINKPKAVEQSIKEQTKEFSAGGEVVGKTFRDNYSRTFEVKGENTGILTLEDVDTGKVLRKKKSEVLSSFKEIVEPDIVDKAKSIIEHLPKGGELKGITEIKVSDNGEEVSYGTKTRKTRITVERMSSDDIRQELIFEKKVLERSKIDAENFNEDTILSAKGLTRQEKEDAIRMHKQSLLNNEQVEKIVIPFYEKHLEIAEQSLKSKSKEFAIGGSVDKEILSIKSRSQANKTFMKAPNGKPTNLNEKQWLQVRTKAFKEWFGDWEKDPKNASKVVDSNGEPVKVFRGDYSKREIFDDNATFFSENDYVAGSYSNEDAIPEYEVFLNIKNPLNLRAENSKMYAGNDPYTVSIFEKAIKELPDDYLFGKGSWSEMNKNDILNAVIKTYEHAGEQIKYVDFNNQSAAWDAIISYAKKNGFDGVLTKDESIDRIIQYQPSQIAFYANQIKSAMDNVGTFSKEAANILYKDGGIIDEATYEKWKSLVNMTKKQLQDFYNSKEGRVAGLSASEAKEKGIDSGRESARWIMKMKDTPVSKWTPAMWKWAKKQISFISRMSGMKGGLYDDNGNKTRKHTSLLIWGHNPESSLEKGGAISDVILPTYRVTVGGDSHSDDTYVGTDLGQAQRYFDRADLDDLSSLDKYMGGFAILERTDNYYEFIGDEDIEDYPIDEWYESEHLYRLINQIEVSDDNFPKQKDIDGEKVIKESKDNLAYDLITDVVSLIRKKHEIISWDKSMWNSHYLLLKTLQGNVELRISDHSANPENILANEFVVTETELVRIGEKPKKVLTDDEDKFRVFNLHGTDFLNYTQVEPKDRVLFFSAVVVGSGDKTSRIFDTSVGDDINFEQVKYNAGDYDAESLYKGIIEDIFNSIISAKKFEEGGSVSEEKGSVGKVNVVVHNISNSAADIYARKLLLKYLKSIGSKNNNSFIKFLKRTNQTKDKYETVFYLDKIYSQSDVIKSGSVRINYTKNIEQAYDDALNNDDESPSFIRVLKDGNNVHYFVAPEMSLFGDANSNSMYGADGHLKNSVKNDAIKLIKKELMSQSYFEEGGATEFGKAISSSSRFKPMEKIVFDKPIVGLNGNKLVSYQWAYEWTMLPNYEGELKSKRVSDWTQADSSAETGRDVVHKFTVERTDGVVVTVSSETVPIILGYIDAKQMKGLPSLVSSVKTLAKQQMQLAILEEQEKIYNHLVDKYTKATKPPIEVVPLTIENAPFALRAAIREGRYDSSARTYFMIGDVVQSYDNEYIYERSSDGGAKFKPATLDSYKRAELESSWVMSMVAKEGGVYPKDIYDLRRRIERQKKKVKQITGDV